MKKKKKNEKIYLEAKQKEEEKIKSNYNVPKQFYFETYEKKDNKAMGRMPSIEVSKSGQNSNENINKSASRKSTFEQVVYMYDSGKNIDDIAKALGKGKGEIRLMLDLMGKGE